MYSRTCGVYGGDFESMASDKFSGKIKKTLEMITKR
jgi:hypothetical protein